MIKFDVTLKTARMSLLLARNAFIRHITAIGAADKSLMDFFLFRTWVNSMMKNSKNSTVSGKEDRVIFSSKTSLEAS